MNDDELATLPPQSIEAEHGVLGALMRWPDNFDKVGDLRPQHFYREDHRNIFAEIVRLAERGQSTDVMSVLAAMQARGGYSDGNLGAYLNQIAQSVPTSFHAAQHARIVVDRALLRALISTADKIVGVAYAPKGQTADQVLDHAQSMVAGLAERRVRNEPRMVREILSEFVDGIAQRSEGQDSAISTGIPELDLRLNGGLRAQQLIIVAGRPSMGKTALSSDIGLNISEQHSVLMFSMEMSSQEVSGRALANRGRVELAKVMGRISEHDTPAWNGVSHGCAKLSDVRFAIDDTPAVTLLELRLKAKAWKRKHGLDVIIVDYIGLMSGGEGDKRSDQIGSYSRGLKAIAKELGVAVIALAQLNRKSEERGDKRPILSDLRDSGEIEQDADVVLLVHRPEMHQPDVDRLRGYTEVLIRKQRNGALGDVHLMFDGPTCRFSGWGGAPPSMAEERPSGRTRGFGG
ncbi:replicative DNA helicase [Duganella sp. FT135W]|uniref:Replicative DNA helicase n=1 Tax=Duganella flavida TaxID=2692175 RepID=A0A6L8KIV5_9BURK|nr:replicative DNA helicase [Duganella flavida]MYM25764.1 replicative DNA helicase [Duganella flavida]